MSVAARCSDAKRTLTCKAKAKDKGFVFKSKAKARLRLQGQALLVCKAKDFGSISYTRTTISDSDLFVQKMPKM